jgi:hypothetical protein
MVACKHIENFTGTDCGLDRYPPGEQVIGRQQQVVLQGRA